MAVLTANADSIVSSERSLARLYHEWDNINLVHIYGKLAFMCDPLNDVVRGALDEHWLVHGMPVVDNAVHCVLTHMDDNYSSL